MLNNPLQLTRSSGFLLAALVFMADAAKADCAADLGRQRAVVVEYNGLVESDMCTDPEAQRSKRVALINESLSLNGRLQACDVTEGTPDQILREMMQVATEIPTRCRQIKEMEAAIENSQAALESSINAERDAIRRRIAEYTRLADEMGRRASGQSGDPATGTGGSSTQPPSPGSLVEGPATAFSATGEENVYRLATPGAKAGPSADQSSLRERLRSKLREQAAPRDATRQAVEQYRASLSEEDQAQFDAAMGTSPEKAPPEIPPLGRPPESSEEVSAAGSQGNSSDGPSGQEEILQSLPQRMRSGGDLEDEPISGAQEHQPKRWYEDLVNEGRVTHGLPPVPR